MTRSAQSLAYDGVNSRAIRIFGILALRAASMSNAWSPMYTQRSGSMPKACAARNNPCGCGLKYGSISSAVMIVGKYFESGRDRSMAFTYERGDPVTIARGRGGGG